MKKKLAALLAAAMVLSTALAGCGSSSSSAAATAETTGADGRETLRVAMSADYAPFDWLQEDDSNGAVMTTNGSYMNGYDVIMAKKIADELDMDLEITQVDWDGLILSISSDMVDCAIAGMSITSERAQSVDFTDPYYSADIVLVVDQNSTYASATSLADLAGATLTSAMNTVWYDALDQVTGATKGAALDTFASMVSAVNAGTIDGFTCDNPSALSLLTTNPNLKIVEFADGQGFQVSSEETDLGIACKKGDTELVDKINTVLAGLSQEDRDAMMDQAVAAQPASAIQ
ncbi:transporter substrate-binding domain-containing protein [Gemmiger formicilis]|uniref:transporter substrate-binding domain-containing protein n=1 Tax=Gemmiger formicilis TaxID=745368 RepID=UPI00195BC47E|nr:transporter substrate-binding domain-containing protein [Gemmiger formicilis]MBM6715965.1 transporter substrate-binding domain-containing protein [Gemmiger formicilis]